MSALSRLRIAGLVEGTTLLLLLFVAMPLKHLADWPLGVTLAGPVHGVAFLFYVVTLVEVGTAGILRGRPLLRGAVACLVPFGTFLNDHSLRRRIAADALR